MSSKLRTAGAIGIVASAAMAGLTMPAQAQDAGRVVPDRVTPPETQAPPSIDLPSTVFSAAPQGADTLTVSVRDVTVENLAPTLSAEVAAITAGVRGQTVTIADLYKIAAQIEALYARDGFVLTRASVPPQQLRNGDVFRIVIVEGFIESVDVTDVPAAARSAVADRLASLVSVKGLSLAQIERQVLLAARVPGVALKTTLTPGTTVGAAKLVVSADHQPASFGFGLDNTLGDAFDAWSFEARASANSAFGFGEQIYGLVSNTSDLGDIGDNPYRRLIGVGGQVPIGNDGLSLDLQYLNAATNPIPGVGGLALRGAFDRLSIGLSYPLILQRQESLTITGAFEALNEHQTITAFDVRLSEDRLRSLSVDLDWRKVLGPDMTVGGRVGVSKGFDWLNARDEQDVLRTGVLFSRMDSEPDYGRVQAEFDLSHRWTDAIEGRLAVRFQRSLSKALPSSKQFALDGDDKVSGFDLGAISTDGGTTARYEIATRIPVSADGVTMPYLFAAAGAGKLYSPTIVEKGDPDASAYGAGVRVSLGQHFYLSGEYAKAESNLFAKDENRLTVRASVQF